jgi:hypothetical protein
VAHQHVAVDAPALVVKCISISFRQLAGEHDSSQHGAALLPGVLTSSILLWQAKAEIGLQALEQTRLTTAIQLMWLATGSLLSQRCAGLV